MKDVLLNCFYDGMSVQDAVKFIESSYCKTPSDRIIEKAKTEIKQFSNSDWK